MKNTKPYLIQRTTLPHNDSHTVTHFHQNVQFILMIKGSRPYQFQDTTISINQENGLFINENVLHTSHQANCDYLWLQFDTERMCPDKTIHEKYIKPVLQRFEYLSLNKDIPWQNDILNQILQLYMFQSAKAEDLDLIALNCFYAIFHLLFSHIPLRDQSTRNNEHVQQLRMMISYIETNYAKQIRLEDIAKSANISNSGCSAIFQELIQDSPYHYLLSFRLEKARTMLMESDLPVTDTALQCGFQDTSHFTRLFRENFGITPAAFRRQSRI